MSAPLSEAEADVLNNAIRLNGRITATICGLLTGAALWLATVVLLLRGGRFIGPHLSLLGIFLPGYSVTWTGAWIGFFWGVILGAIVGRILYWGYARKLRSQFDHEMVPASAQSVAPATLLISGSALGLGLGIAAALPLLLSTNWLVLRGTAASSRNAALLGYVLPGYTVSTVGSLIGAAELFVLAFAAAQLLSVIYNSIARGAKHG